MLERTAASESALGETDLPLKLPTRIITCAWGEKYVGELLSMTVPALLAPGNLPYVASVVPCELVVVTQEACFNKVLADPAIRRIRELCDVRLIGMDDLIPPSRDHYGMAITYTLHRGFSDLGPSATDTWLLFLNADFVLADGSLRNVVRHLAQGKRLIAAPSYCVKAEEAAPELLKRIDLRSRALSIPPRDMAALVLQHRHDSVRGKTVNQNAISIRYMDQFYWLINSNTLLGHQMPVAILGMRPERNLPEPNSYWDYGLMREFCPHTEHFILGNSDEFLMMELRREHVTEGWVSIGWPKSAEIAENMLLFATPYTKDMARHPLTLHSGELPEDVEQARAKLRAFVDSVFDHLPGELPSHLGHPQFEYSWSSFMEARHRYLSTRLGSATETEEPPASLTELDRVWWKLDGVTKAYSRKRAELTGLISRQRDVVIALESGLQDVVRKHQTEADERLLHALSGIQPRDQKSATLNHMVHLKPNESASTGWNSVSIANEHPCLEPIFHDADQWTRFSTDLAEKKEFITNTLEFIDKHYKDHLLGLEVDFETVREQLQFDYERLLRRPIRPAATPITPNWITRHGPPPPAARDRTLRRMARGIYRRWYGKMPRVQVLHPYWAAMRHLIRVVDAAAERGAANVLVVTGGGGVADKAADHLPGVHAQVSWSELMARDFSKYWDHRIKFDLCICSLGADELGRFRDMAIAVARYMNSGGKILGFYPNFSLRSVSTDESVPLQNIIAPPWSGRIYYTGSKRSARIIRRFNSIMSRHDSDRLTKLGRMGMMLLAFTPSALFANLSEATEESPSQAPKHCTSIMIEVNL